MSNEKEQSVRDIVDEALKKYEEQNPHVNEEPKGRTIAINGQKIDQKNDLFDGLDKIINGKNKRR